MDGLATLAASCRHYGFQLKVTPPDACAILPPAALARRDSTLNSGHAREPPFGAGRRLHGCVAHSFFGRVASLALCHALHERGVPARHFSAGAWAGAAVPGLWLQDPATAAVPAHCAGGRVFGAGGLGGLHRCVRHLLRRLRRLLRRRRRRRRAARCRSLLRTYTGLIIAPLQRHAVRAASEGSDVRRLRRRQKPRSLPPLAQAERWCWPAENQHLETLFPPSPTPYRFLNSGGYVGRAMDVVEALTSANASNTDDDQGCLQRLFLAQVAATQAHGEAVAAQAWSGSHQPPASASGCDGSGEVGQLQRGRIVLDYRCELLQTHAGEDVHDGGEALQWDAMAGRWANRMTGTRPWLFHANGGLLMKVRQGRPGRGEGEPQRDVVVYSSLARSSPYHGNEAFAPTPSPSSCCHVGHRSYVPSSMPSLLSGCLAHVLKVPLWRCGGGRCRRRPRA
jgi:hypothetical protein